MGAPREVRTLFGVRHFLAAAFYYAASICLFGSASLSHRMAEDQGEASPNQFIPWAQLGVNATAQYSGDGLRVIATPVGAELRCVLQKLEGEVTVDGLSLSSTVPAARDQLQVTTTRLGRDGGQNLVLDKNGAVQVIDAHARYVRPGLIEEYSVSADGIRQDFIVTEPPPGAGALRLHLTVRGAQAEPSRDGARLVFEATRRQLNYHRLRVTDATGRQLAARIEVAGKSKIENLKSKIDLAVVVEDAGAFYPLRIDPTFSDANWISMNSLPGADDWVYAAVVDGSGNLYIGGAFTVVGDVVANGIAKWNGSSWSALGPGLNGSVYALAALGSNVYAAGSFSTGSGSPGNFVAKWNGSSWSALGSGPDGYVYALAVSGSDVYAGGWSWTLGGPSGHDLIPVAYIAKWNGSFWGNLGSQYNAMVLSLAVSSGDLYAGGTFTNMGGISANCIAKWNGNSWSALGSGMNGGVSALAVSGSDLYAAGGNIAKWNGSSWSPLGSGLAWGPVRALVVSGNDVYAGGDFTTAGGSSAMYIAKWNGSSWSALSSGMNNRVYALAVSGSDLYAGGLFGMAGGMAADHIARWNGSSWTSLGSGMGLGRDASVNALAVSGTNVYAAGQLFTTSGGVATNIARWNGSRWTALGSGVNFGFPKTVAALAVSGSDLYAGGSFTTAGEIPAKKIAKWNGSSWTALGSGISAPAGDPYYGGIVYALAVSGSDTYAGGAFTNAGGTAANHIAKWNGSSWTALGSGISGPLNGPYYGGSVFALAVSGSDLYVGGAFTNAGGNVASNIAKWNGSTWTALGSGMNRPVYALAVSGSDLYAAGDFGIAGGSLVNHVAKWNGSTWSALGSGVEGGFVRALAVSGSDLYVGGTFTYVGGNPANYIAKWDGISWSALGSGMGGIRDRNGLQAVHALAISGSDLYAGGEFMTAGGKVSPYVARGVLGEAPGYNQLTGAPLSSGAMQLSYIGYPATNYALDRAFNLSEPISWFGQQTNTMTISGVLMFTNRPAPGTNNFWRIRSVP